MASAVCDVIMGGSMAVSNKENNAIAIAVARQAPNHTPRRSISVGSKVRGFVWGRAGQSGVLRVQRGQAGRRKHRPARSYAALALARIPLLRRGQ